MSRQSIQLQASPVRKDWVSRVEGSGLLWHGDGADSYWNESEHLVLTLEAAEVLEQAANDLHQMCLHACEQIICRDWWHKLGLSEPLARMIQDSWVADDFSIYGRFDLAWDGRGSPKLLEYNADTPTSLLETAVIQWDWLQDLYPSCDQLNSLHEALVEQWQRCAENDIHFACAWDLLEDRQTIAYLAETAEQAGKIVHLLDMAEIGFSPEGRFTDLQERAIDKLFKLYPWEWMVQEPFFAEMGHERSRFVEPMWKMMLSHKGLLPILWELFPQHPLLLPASLAAQDMAAWGVSNWVEKPIYGREGSGVRIFQSGQKVCDSGREGESNTNIYQQTAPMFEAGGKTFVWGLWMVDGECRGLSARGDVSPITGNMSRFYPHRIHG
jgi:glutathionylspermidine synthase